MSENRKKVLFLVTKSGLGGASRSVYELASSMTGRFDVAVAAGGNGELFEKLHACSVRCIPLPELSRDINILREFRTFAFIMALIRREHPDVLHLHSPKAGGLGALAGRLSGIKNIVYTAHGWAFFEDRPFYQKVLIRLFSYVTLLLSHTTIAVSKKDAEAFNGWPFTKGKVVYIPNGVSTTATRSHEEARTALNALGVPLGKPIVGAIGELHKNKGFSYLIEAAAKIPDATFVIIGEGEERKRLELAIAAHHLSERVVLVGYVRDAAQLISGFDIFTLPSLKEGLPYVLLEAGARGIPTVATAVGGVPEIIESEHTGLLVPAKDYPRLASAIERLLKETPFAQKIGNTLKQKTEKDFLLELMLEKTQALY